VPVARWIVKSWLDTRNIVLKMGLNTNMSIEYDFTVGGFKFLRTCGACPEQYDVFDDTDTQVAYLRLRHGRFTVKCPDVGGKLVYHDHPNGDGCFDADERYEYLSNASRAIEKFLVEESWKEYDRQNYR
jgi:hypothetical protein